MPVAAPEDIELEIPLTETQTAFVESQAPIVALIGPEGEGKTYSGLAAVIRHAQDYVDQFGDPLRCAIIRDTFENILTKTKPSIDKAVLSIARANDNINLITQFEWHRGGKKLVVPGLLDADLFGCDDLPALARLQGGEWSLIWIEEPAPMFMGNNAGVPREVFDACVSRAARGGGAMRLQITMNPADEEHWTFDVLVANPIMRPPETPHIWTEVFHIPYGDNPTRTDLQRQATKAAYKHDAAMYSRLVLGKFAFVKLGPEVTPEYHEDIHYSKARLAVLPGCMGFRGWDGGHNPTCLIGQITPSGRLIFQYGLTMEHVGMQQLIDTKIKPIINMFYGGIDSWLDTGDPTLETGDQGDTEQSPKVKIEKAFNTSFIPASHWPAVKEPMKNALNLMIDGKPYIRIGKDCEILHKALRGGWHYQKLNSGLILRDKPVKDKHSHPGDCFGAICLKLLGTAGKKRAMPKIHKTSTVSYG
jgi:hypothetical protein